MEAPPHHSTDSNAVPQAATAADALPTTSGRPIKNRRFAPKRIVRMLGLVLVCVLSGALGSYLLLATGWIKPDVTQTITQNRDKIVLQQGEIVADVAKKVGPSVVSITSIDQASGSPFGAGETEGAGSGIIISADGYILTNKHVIPEGSKSITVITASGKQYKDVTIVGRDPVNDLAFLKINNVSGLPAATLGDSGSVTVGQQVVAIGNALGVYQNSVSSGIISGLGRPVTASSEGSDQSENLENLLQTDAAINPGNSGGPLLNLAGEVIGINTAIASDGQGIGFAIPINDAKGVVTSVIKNGKVQRGLLGVRYVTVNQAVVDQYNLSVQNGAYLVGDGSSPAIVPGGAGDKAGLKSGDVITKVAGQTVDQSHSLLGLLSQYNVGEAVSLTIVRGDKTLEVKATLQAAT